MTRTEILQEALNQRTQEVLQYQINIDNYVLAIEKIQQEHTGTEPIDMAMQAFMTNLQNLLESSLIEQRKAQILLDVITTQLAE